MLNSGPLPEETTHSFFEGPPDLLEQSSRSAEDHQLDLRHKHAEIVCRRKLCSRTERHPVMTACVLRDCQF